MSDLIVLTFDTEEEAGNVREAIHREQKQDLVSLDDSAVVVRDKHGKIHVKNELDRGVKIGAVGGGVLGLLIAGIFFPFAGILIGVLGGMGVGALANLGVQKKFVKEVSDKLEPGTSAIFLIVRHANAAAVVAALKPYKGEIYQSTLDTEDEETLRRVLKDRTE
ncbi:DUF1269 domain-containing protein [Caldilinea sp.]|uniref:DUF1269 domain-containing protein n=1 Tax=Caldilinea sp. TaxID=2293560 RepID=UPI002D0261FE|nr:DUF1269 domain-containing protein [Anaerolineales bacterium]HQY93040.1 DUF1269 domain-containing protein [Caldilinea sp.]